MIETETGEKHAHGEEQLRAGNPPPVDEMRCPREEQRADVVSQYNCKHGLHKVDKTLELLCMVHDVLGLVREPGQAHRGLDDLLDNDGPDNLCASDHIALGHLFGRVNTILVEPAPVRHVEHVEEEGGDPVRDYNCREGDDAVGDALDEAECGGVVEWIGAGEEAEGVILGSGCAERRVHRSQDQAANILIMS